MDTSAKNTESPTYKIVGAIIGGRPLNFIVDTSSDTEVGYCDSRSEALRIMADLEAAEAVEDTLPAAASDLLGWLAGSRWGTGKPEYHTPTLHTDLSSQRQSVDCRCGEAWPCPYVRVQRIVREQG
jgi:hypothetical protein